MIASHRSCDGKCVASKGGEGYLLACSMSDFRMRFAFRLVRGFLAIGRVTNIIVPCAQPPQVAAGLVDLPISGEQQQQGDEEREDAESFRHGEAEDQAAELAVGSRGVAQRAPRGSCRRWCRGRCRRRPCRGKRCLRRLPLLLLLPLSKLLVDQMRIVVSDRRRQTPPPSLASGSEQCVVEIHAGQNAKT